MATTCPADQKDDGTGNCVPVGDSCAAGYKDNGQGVCIYSSLPCATDFHDNGDRTACIAVNGTCADNYIEDATG